MKSVSIKEKHKKFRMGIGIALDPNPCAKDSYEECIIPKDTEDFDRPITAPVVLFRYPKASKAFEKLVSFTREVINSNDKEEIGESSLFGARDGGGLIDIVCAGALDPRCNPHHGNAIQFLDDQHLLDLLASSNSVDQTIFATSVFLLADVTSTKMSEAVLKFGSVERVALITVSDVGGFIIGKDTHPIMRKGELVVLSSPTSITSFKVTSGAFVGVCFGTPGTVRARSAMSACKSLNASIDARIVLRSNFYNDIPSTVNRPAATSGLYQAQIACPDCRRALNISQDIVEETVRRLTDEELNIVVVVWHSEMVEKLEEFDTTPYKPQTRWLLYTDEKLLEGKEHIKTKWPNQVQVRRMSRHSIKRGNLDSCVPAGFVSPTLFSRESDIAMYTLIQGLSLSQLEGRLIRLVDLSSGDHINMRSRINLYRQIIYELRDWNHPCHRPRRSAIGLLKEWTRSYSLRDLV